MNQPIKHTEIADPKYRRLRRALRKAERFLSKSIEEKDKRKISRAADRWNSVAIKAYEVMK